MKLMRSISLIAVAFGLVGLSAVDAAAQAPTVTWQQNGATLSVNWTAVPGATDYDVQVSGALNGAVTIPTNFLQVNAPAGTYILQVRGRNGATVGPASDPVTITVTNGGSAPGGCLPLTAPPATASVSGNVVTVSWGLVPGAIGYRIQVGTSPGATQFQTDVPASQSSYSSPIPVLGTFYVRVIAANACGTVLTSPETTFTVGAASPGPGPSTPTPGAGPRSANPTAANGVLCMPGRPDLGYCIPVQSLSYATGVVNQVAAANGFDVFNSCREHGGNMNFVYKTISALRRIDSRWALNLKRGNQGLSEDIIAFNPTDRPDNGESQIYLFDIIGGHCGSNPQVNGLNDVTLTTWNAGLANTPGCSTRFCAAWTLQGYLQAGFQP